jgi:NTP pyrophosphatase (non-canonical NTP hydrolase)
MSIEPWRVELANELVERSLVSPETLSKLAVIGFGAIKVYGPKAQWDQLQEEACELGVAVSHARRGRGSNLIEELADMTIMLTQARLMVTDEELSELDDMINVKLDRLQARAKAWQDRANPILPKGHERVTLYAFDSLERRGDGVGELWEQVTQPVDYVATEFCFEELPEIAGRVGVDPSWGESYRLGNCRIYTIYVDGAPRWRAEVQDR